MASAILSSLPGLARQCTSSTILLRRWKHRPRNVSAPKPWLVGPRKIGQPNIYSREISPANKTFLKDKLEETYASKDYPVSPLKDGPWQRNPWTLSTRRAGVLAVKLGTVPQWTKEGNRFEVTMLQVLDNHVIKYIPPEDFAHYPSYERKWKKGYASCVVGALSSSPHYYRQEYNCKFDEAGVPPKRKLTRFLVTPDAAIQPGTPLTAMHFRVGDYVDVQAKSIGHGFQGVVKRWGFKGGPASHGATKWHRRPGSSGGHDRGRVWKGKKMPGQMGFRWVDMKGLKIHRINTRYNVLYVTGYNLPGPTHCYVRVMDTVLLNHRWNWSVSDAQPIMPTFHPEDALETIPEEIFDDDLHHMDMSNIAVENKKL